LPVPPNMETFLDKNIDRICGNNFVDPAANHCAHFVSHAMGFTFSFNCRQHTGGIDTPANIRVQEIFARCPSVGRWEDANVANAQLIFVIRKDAVNLATKTMQNIPEKHIGVYQNGYVYHYFNDEDKVVKQTVPDFFARYQAKYAGDQGLFFGEFPVVSDAPLTS
jgi:hypothetical protein